MILNQKITSPIHFQNGMTIETENDMIRYILSKCCENDSVETFKYVSTLIDIKSDSEIVIFHACKCGSLNIVKYLLSIGFDIHASAEQLLILAVEHDHEGLIKLLIKNGANINANDGYVLSESIARNDPEFVTWLIKHGAQSGSRYEENIYKAIHNDCIEIIKLFVDKNKLLVGNEKLYYIVESNNLEVMRHLVENKVFVLTGEIFTGFMFVARIKKFYKMMEYLEMMKIEGS